MRLKLINDWETLDIPIDVRFTGVVAGRDGLPGRWAARRDGSTVGDDITVFVVSRMSVTEADLAAAIVP